MAKRKTQKIKVDGKVYTLISWHYDWQFECTFYNVVECDEPFCDLNNKIELLNEEDE